MVFGYRAAGTVKEQIVQWSSSSASLLSLLSLWPPPVVEEVLSSSSLTSNTFCQNYFWKYAPACLLLIINHPLSINIDVQHQYWCGISEITRQVNCSLIFPRSTCLDVYETLLCQRGCWQARGGANACRAKTTFVFQSLHRGGPDLSHKPK